MGDAPTPTRDELFGVFHDEEPLIPVTSKSLPKPVMLARDQQKLNNIRHDLSNNLKTLGVIGSTNPSVVFQLERLRAAITAAESQTRTTIDLVKSCTSTEQSQLLCKPCNGMAGTTHLLPTTGDRL